MVAESLVILLALGTAVAFATSVVLVRLGVREAEPLVALVVTLTINVVLLWSYSLLRYDVVFDLWAWRYFILAGTLAPVLGRLCNYVGIRHVGVNLSVPISNANPAISVVLAVAILGETLAPLGVPGVLAVIFGGVLLATVSNSETTEIDPWYLVFPLLSMMFFGMAQVIRKMGLNLIAVPTVGAAVNLTTSFLLALGYVAVSHREVEIMRRDLQYFVPAGIASSIGVALLYTALELGTVVIVTPILNTSPLFALALTYLFVREGELFTWRVVIGTVSIIVGVGLLSVVS